MVKLLNVLVLVSGLAATAFSLNQKVNNRITSATHSRNALPQQKLAFHNAPSFLMSATDSAEAAPSTEIVAEAKPAAKGGDNLFIAAAIGVWYIGNIAYNIYNKKACIALGKNSHGHSNAHWALSAVQLLVGVVFVTPMWLTKFRTWPALTGAQWKALAPVGLMTCLAHAFSVLALGAGAVSFGQIVKAAEPVFAAFTNAIVLKEIDHPLVYAALIPIIGGVGLASLKELSFTWTALIAASLANQAAALKNVVGKKVMKEDFAKKMGAANQYSIVTMIALAWTLPLVLAFDAKDFGAVYKQVLAMGTGADVIKYSVLSGLSFYVYNEAAFLALSKLDAVTHSVANTLKRVVIIVASCVVFKTPMTLLGGIGSAVAVAGTLLYSLAKGKFSKSGGH